MRILIVEDEVKIREGISKLIQNHTTHEIVAMAKNGQEGLAAVMRYQPDLVITDIRMPVMDGMELIETMHQNGFRPFVIILSGYAEFEYAQKAIKYGVQDYILKPIGAEDITEVLKKAEKQLQIVWEERKKLPENYIRDIIVGSSEGTVAAQVKLAEECGLPSNGSYLAFLAYIGSAPDGYYTLLVDKQKLMASRYPESRFFMTQIERSREVFLLVQNCQDEEALKSLFFRHMVNPFRGKVKQPIWTSAGFTELNQLHQVAARLQQYLEFGLTLGGDELIEQMDVERFQERSFSYPAGFESQIKIALCNSRQVRGLFDEFKRSLREQRSHPRDIRMAYLKAYTAIMRILNEIDSGLEEKLAQRKLIDILSSAHTMAELEAVLDQIADIVENSKAERTDIRNFTIMKAINYIKDNYQNGITLEEVARYQDITPEYLSTLFNREVGINFSVFLKQYRISQAKRLLKGTELKIYQIAEQVGYSDPKYFNRVFKEEMGISPNEYRQS